MNIKRTDETAVAAPDAVKTGAISARESRRRFVRAAGVVVPVILTVGSRSALACTCLSPSASASINLTHSRPNRPRDGVCAGRSPGYWKNHDGFELARKTQFSSVFPGGFPGKSMKQVTGLGGNGNFEALGRHLAAAWCNLRSGLVSSAILSEADMKLMWAGRYGSYAPIDGGTVRGGQARIVESGGSVRWGESEIVQYLRTATMI